MLYNSELKINIEYSFDEEFMLMKIYKIHKKNSRLIDSYFLALSITHKLYTIQLAGQQTTQQISH